MSRQRLRSLILACYVGLGIVYSLTTPPLEASDEFVHYPVVQHIQNHWSLPVMDPDNPEPWRQEGAQPPFYYALAAGLTFWIDTGDLLDVRWVNDHAFIGMPEQLGNKNLIIHRPELESFPWRGTVLAVHLIRFMTVALGAVTVWLVWCVADMLCPNTHWVAPLAAALTAFNPMFLFTSAAVNNDALSALLGSLAVLLLLRALEPKSGTSLKDSVLVSLSLGVVLGLGILTKVSLIVLVPLAVLAILIRLWRVHWVKDRRRFLWETVICTALMVLIVAGLSAWWFLRNFRLYGDPLALNVFIEIMGRRTEPLTWVGLWEEFGTFRRTYWGLFGGVNVLAPGWVYVIYDLFSLLGLGGLALGVWRLRRVPVRRWWVPVLLVVGLFVSLLRWTLIYYSFQGRLMFPGISSLSTLLAVGLGQWLPQARRPAASWAISAMLLLLAVLLPFVTILPAYAYPEPMVLDDVPEVSTVDPVVFGSGLVELVGVDAPFQVVAPVECVELTLYWHVLAPIDSDYLTAVHLLGRDLVDVGRVTRHPVMGMVPTSLWEEGQVWRDAHMICVDEEPEAPTRLMIRAALYDAQLGRDLPAATTDEVVLDPLIVGTAKLVPTDWSRSQPAHPLEVALADGVSLRGYDLEPGIYQQGRAIDLTLYWAAEAVPSQDYTVFIHMLGVEGETVFFGDGPPVGGYYPTGIWAPGEVIADRHIILIPPDQPEGSYRILVGMYDLATLSRLTRVDGLGDHVELPMILEIR